MSSSAGSTAANAARAAMIRKGAATNVWASTIPMRVSVSLPSNRFAPRSCTARRRTAAAGRSSAAAARAAAPRARSSRVPNAAPAREQVGQRRAEHRDHRGRDRRGQQRRRRAPSRRPGGGDAAGAGAARRRRSAPAGRGRAARPAMAAGCAPARASLGRQPAPTMLRTPPGTAEASPESFGLSGVSPLLFERVRSGLQQVAHERFGAGRVGRVR